MTEALLHPLVEGDEIAAQLRRRKQKDVFKTVGGSTKKIIAGKVALEEEDGWRVVRRNAKSTRVAKPKPADEQLEDEVWSILAQMGFGQMSLGRQFTIAAEAGLSSRQIDVFAKDDETALLVECTQRDTPGRKNMSALIEKLKAIREPINSSITKFYGAGSRPKVKFVVATRNISWSDADLAKCEEAQIAVLADGELDYYSMLVQHLKTAARYQMLAHMFAGQKISGLSRKVVATRGRMGKDNFYTFLIRPDELLKIAYVGHKASRDVENLDTYQRMLQPRRLKRIAQYINEGGKFPTNIVINLKTTRRSGLKFEVHDTFGDEALGVLHLPANYASAWIIDGQHRLYGYAHAREAGGYETDRTTIPVLAYENLPAEREMNLFIDINSKQVKVSQGLLVELYSDLHWKSSDPEEAFQALLSRIASRLNALKTSPLHDRMVVTGKKKSNFRCLTQTSIRDGLGVAKLMGTLSKGAILPGPLSTSAPNEFDANLRKGIDVVSDCLELFRTELLAHWRTGDGPGGYLCTNNGIRALFHVIRDVAEHIRHDTGADLYVRTAEETVEEITPYLQFIIDYFKTATPQDVQAFRRVGSSLTAVRQQSFGLEALIHERNPSFRPSGLIEYLESRDEAGTEQAAARVTRIHRRLFSFVIGKLKAHYGVQNKAWWTKGIPLKIRQSCTAEWEAKNREGEEESQLYLISYIEICTDNWALFKDSVSLGAKDKDNKKSATKWIKDLNEIRKITTHPERGILTAEQVELVRDIHEKVEQFLPVDDEDEVGRVDEAA
ncbi:DGQHR domain-containing protein [Sphingosinithalassobacter tenebrarum]|uniref:DGQHR domain-containing protein n=2 Tax=Stakelama tenebrarum TaxID=2711215 RepID=A0A6G6YAW6_9SPHN|nr:DGQHR domain-containing protein [Sphingosinithalassobacter tenebrarum]